MTRSFGWIGLLVLVALTASAHGSEVQVLKLWPDDPAPGVPYGAGDVLRERQREPGVWDLYGVQYPSLERQPTPQGDQPAPAMIICAGGGYRFESVTLEGTDVAAALVGKGVAAFVLRYRLPDGHMPGADELPVPQQDVLRAIQLVRSHAAEWRIDPNRIGVIGFSAGGHLAATAATLYDQAPLLAGKAKNDAISKVSARPDFAVLIYPVITMNKTNTHTGSRKYLIGPSPDAATEERFSTDKHVTPQTPPLYIVVAEDDKTVPPVNAHMMAEAAEKAGVPHALLDLKTGGHGFGLGKPGAETGDWFAACMTWLKSQKLVPAKA